MIVTLGLFSLYLFPSWSRPVGRVTGTRRMSFGRLLALGLLTLGVALAVAQVRYATALARHGRRVGTTGTNPQLASWVLTLTVVSFVWSVATLGIGFLVGGFALGVYSPRLVQEELNLYFDESVAE